METGGNVNKTETEMRRSYESYNFDETLEHLLKDFEIRKTGEELKKIIEEKAMKLNKSVAELEQQMKKVLGPANFLNWVEKGKPISRVSAIKIAYALQMEDEEADEFLTSRCWHESFYYRDYRDVIYLYGLVSHWSFEQAEALIKKYAWLDNPNPDPVAAGVNNLTETLKDEYYKAFFTDEEFEKYLNDNWRLFGSFRMKAYEVFIAMIEELKKRWKLDKKLDNEIGREALREKEGGIERIVNADYYKYEHDDVSDEKICKEIAMGIPNLYKCKSDVLKAISGNIPIRSTLSEIREKTRDKKGRIEQVPRKYLILAWLLLNDAEPLLDEGDDKEAKFTECLANLNEHLLKPCGFHLLDYRNPFDWLVVNALRSSYYSVDEEENDAILRIRKFAKALF